MLKTGSLCSLVMYLRSMVLRDPGTMQTHGVVSVHTRIHSPTTTARWCNMRTEMRECMWEIQNFTCRKTEFLYQAALKVAMPKVMFVSWQLDLESVKFLHTFDLTQHKKYYPAVCRRNSSRWTRVICIIFWSWLSVRLETWSDIRRNMSQPDHFP